MTTTRCRHWASVLPNCPTPTPSARCSAALEIGYRLIDTASAYGNEAAVGRAIAASGIPRAEIFLTTKLATDDQGYQSSQDAIKASLERLGMDYVDLYLIHWPATIWASTSTASAA